MPQQKKLSEEKINIWNDTFDEARRQEFPPLEAEEFADKAVSGYEKNRKK